MDYQQYAPVSAPAKNGMAITSMVAGIVGWVFFLLTLCYNFTIGAILTVATYGIGSVCSIILGCISPIAWIVAVITGHVAKNQIRDTGASGGGMATAGLIMGYIGVGLVVLAICAAIIMVILVLGFGLSIPLLNEISYPSY